MCHSSQIPQDPFWGIWCQALGMSARLALWWFSICSCCFWYHTKGYHWHRTLQEQLEEQWPALLCILKVLHSQHLQDTFCKAGNIWERQGQQLLWGLTALVCADSRLNMLWIAGLAPSWLTCRDIWRHREAPRALQIPTGGYVTGSAWGVVLMRLLSHTNILRKTKALMRGVK